MSSFWGAPSVNAETSFKYGQEPAGAFAVRRPKTHFRAVVLPTIRPLRISALMIPSVQATRMSPCHGGASTDLFQGSSDRVRLLHFPGTR